MDLAISGFQCTGIYRFNKDIFTELGFLPAINTRAMPEKDTRVDDGSELFPAATITFSLLKIMPIEKLLTVEMALPVNVGLSTSTSKTFQVANHQISAVADDLQRKIIVRKRREE